MGLTSGHRCMIVWSLSVFTFVPLVLYLDNKGASPPYLLFVAFVVADIVWITWCVYHTVRAVKIYRTATNPAANLDYWLFIEKNKVIFGQIACLALKITFDVIIFLRICLDIPIPIWGILTPLWIGLVFILTDLTYRLYHIQTPYTRAPAQRTLSST